MNWCTAPRLRLCRPDRLARVGGDVDAQLFREARHRAEIPPPSPDRYHPAHHLGTRGAWPHPAAATTVSSGLRARNASAPIAMRRIISFAIFPRSIPLLPLCLGGYPRRPLFLLRSSVAIPKGALRVLRVSVAIPKDRSVFPAAPSWRSRKSPPCSPCLRGDFLRGSAARPPRRSGVAWPLMRRRHAALVALLVALAIQ